ncbi:tRNA adenosine deaminase-associated protein [Allostreptomyces psammosilenae]|uniref:Putative tRNA adenosine deaminase-associated protein n=1 Tax=Allostreptomyces psammosilenae TaxID=1892865 RepID=A0A852ZSY6_9ACTN|nr:tRNA adenosine deaminase-associated protein [Allostreptomyces psammosilenae]NYI05513.1 putative tRNA adenosine deaminase-associated protein [Allostreptomyces psammosilenae]
MAYFAALLARTEDGWDATEPDLDSVETLADLADLAREASVDEDTVIVFLEQEDSWFALVRVDGEEDPRIYLSDGAAAARSAYGEILLTDELLGRETASVAELPDLDELEAEESDTDEDIDDEAVASSQPPAGPLGDAGLLDDLGMSEEDLVELSNDGALPGDALGAIAEALGCEDVLEAVR